jgi:hypothetical protein
MALPARDRGVTCSVWRETPAVPVAADGCAVAGWCCPAPVTCSVEHVVGLSLAGTKLHSGQGRRGPGAGVAWPRSGCEPPGQRTAVAVAAGHQAGLAQCPLSACGKSPAGVASVPGQWPAQQQCRVTAVTAVACPEAATGPPGQPDQFPLSGRARQLGGRRLARPRLSAVLALVLLCTLVYYASHPSLSCRKATPCPLLPSILLSVFPAPGIDRGDEVTQQVVLPETPVAPGVLLRHCLVVRVVDRARREPHRVGLHRDVARWVVAGEAVLSARRIRSHGAVAAPAGLAR